MAYTKTTWVNDSLPYLNATNLNKIETGIEDAHTAIDSFTASDADYNQGDTEAVTRTIEAKLQELVSIKDFGAVGDYDPDTDTGTDDTTAIQAAIDYAKTNNVVLYVPSGFYLVSDELDCLGSGSNVRWGIVGESRWSSVFVVDSTFIGHSKSLFKGVEDTPSTRATGSVTFHNFRCEVEDVTTANPHFINFGGYTEFHHSNLTFGNSSNTKCVWWSSYNSQINSLTSYYGGKHYNYKDIDGITFGISSGTTTLTSSAAAFSAGDVGKYILIKESSGDAQLFLISAYTNTTTVTVSDTAKRTLTSAVGAFEPARGSMTAAGTTLTANCNCFSSSDVDRLVYVADAGADGGLLCARIASYTAANSVELDTAATGTVSDVYFTTPHFAIAQSSVYQGPNADSPESNDLTFEDILIENFLGVGLVVDRATDTALKNIKIHGDSTPTTADGYSLHHLWLDDVHGHFDGWLESNTTGAGGRVQAWNQNGIFNFRYLRLKLDPGMQFAETHSFSNGGLITADTIQLIGDVAADARNSMLDGETGSDPRVYVKGQVSSPNRELLDRPMTNPNAGDFKGWYEGPNSSTVTLYGSTTPGEYTYDRQIIRWTRIGHMVFFTVDVLLTGITTAATGDMQIGPLPYTSLNTSLVFGGSMAYWKLDTDSAGDVPTFVVAPNDTHLNLFLSRDNSAQDTLDPANILTDTRMVLTGFYEVEPN